MLKIMQLNSYFVIRLKKDTFIDQRYKMTTNDEIIEVPLYNSFIKTITNEELKEFASKQEKLKLRIVNIHYQQEKQKHLQPTYLMNQ